MMWMLVVFVANTPVKTELVYDSLRTCLEASETMRREWSEVLNEPADGRSYLQMQRYREDIGKHVTWGTCIPHAGSVSSS